MYRTPKQAEEHAEWKIRRWEDEHKEEIMESFLEAIQAFYGDSPEAFFKKLLDQAGWRYVIELGATNREECAAFFMKAIQILYGDNRDEFIRKLREAVEQPHSDSFALEQLVDLLDDSDA